MSIAVGNWLFHVCDIVCLYALCFSDSTGCALLSLFLALSKKYFNEDEILNQWKTFVSILFFYTGLGIQFIFCIILYCEECLVIFNKHSIECLNAAPSIKHFTADQTGKKISKPVVISVQTFTFYFLYSGKKKKSSNMGGHLQWNPTTITVIHK